MMRGVLTVSTLVSVVMFPWPFTAALALASSLLEPLVPLSAGILADTLFYTPHGGAFPIAALSGVAVTAVAIFVRSRLSAGIMRQ